MLDEFEASIDRDAVWQKVLPFLIPGRELTAHAFLDGSDGRFRDAVRVLFAGEKVREEYTQPAADV